jgi:hypothetical protein
LDSKYLLRVIREPLPGKTFELMNAVIEHRSLKGDSAGMTAMSVASPWMQMISSTPYASLADMQAKVDGMFENTEAQTSWDRVGTLASSTVINLSRVVVSPTGIEDANYVQRYIFKHDSTSRPQLIAALQEMAAHSDDDGFGITASLTDNTVVASRAVKSLAELEGPFDRLRDDPGTITRSNNVLVHCSDWFAVLTKVVSRP